MTSFYTIRYLCVPIAWLSLSAHAATYSYIAETGVPAKKQGAVMAAGVFWNCGGSQCTTSGPWAVPGVGACAALAQQIGNIKSYGHSQKKLSAPELAQCNAGVADAKPSAPSSNAPNPSAKSKIPDNVPPTSKPVAPPEKGSAPDTNTPAKSGGFLPKDQTSSKSSARSGPAAFTTESLTITGTGVLAGRGAFTPRTFTVEGLAVTGIGTLTARREFSPKTFTATDGLTITGTGALR
jgi:hypothetical protein